VRLKPTLSAFFGVRYVGKTCAVSRLSSCTGAPGNAGNGLASVFARKSRQTFSDKYGSVNALPSLCLMKVSRRLPLWCLTPSALPRRRLPYDAVHIERGLGCFSHLPSATPASSLLALALNSSRFIFLFWEIKSNPTSAARPILSASFAARRASQI